MKTKSIDRSGKHHGNGVISDDLGLALARLFSSAARQPHRMDNVLLYDRYILDRKPSTVHPLDLRLAQEPQPDHRQEIFQTAKDSC
jgi:hypothetical protein